jgi:hypothetical protein
MRLLLRLRSRGELAARPPGAAVYRLKNENQGDNDYAVVSQVMAELSRESAIRERRACVRSAKDGEYNAEHDR